jgi:hypothetical protein
VACQRHAAAERQGRQHGRDDEPEHPGQTHPVIKADRSARNVKSSSNRLGVDAGRA